MQRLSAKTKIKNTQKSREQVEYETMMGSLGTIGAVPALIGLWSAVCFTSALIMTGSPWSLARCFFSAITGI